MKKNIVLLITFSVLLFLVSCGDKNTVYPDFEHGLILEIKADVRSEESDIVLGIKKSESRYTANIIEPKELSNVSLIYENSAVTLISDTVELTLDETAATGFAVIFQALDDLSALGAPEKGRQFEIGGYHVEVEPSPSQLKISFTINGEGFNRSFVMREQAEEIDEREPETTG